MDNLTDFSLTGQTKALIVDLVHFVPHVGE